MTTIPDPDDFGPIHDPYTGEPPAVRCQRDGDGYLVFVKDTKILLGSVRPAPGTNRRRWIATSHFDGRGSSWCQGRADAIDNLWLHASCEYDGEDEDQWGGQHYWHCDSLGTEQVGHSRYCPQHAEQVRETLPWPEDVERHRIESARAASDTGIIGDTEEGGN